MEEQQLQTTAQLNLEVQDNISAVIKKTSETVSGLQLKLFLAETGVKGLAAATNKYRDASVSFAKQNNVATATINAQAKSLTSLNESLNWTAKGLSNVNKAAQGAWALTVYADAADKVWQGWKRAKESIEQIPRTMALMESSGVWTGVISEARQYWEITKLNQEATESFVNSAVSRFTQFEKSITLVNTILGLTGVGIKGAQEELDDYADAKAGLASATVAETDVLKRYEQALEASRLKAVDFAQDVQSLVDNELKNAVSATQALDASYQALSSGYTQAAEAQAVMTTGLKLSYAGAADASTTMKALTQSMQAYKIAANDSAKVANVLLQTVNLGITTLPELAGGFAQTAVVAKEAGVKIEELGASVAALTLKGNNSATALTGLEALFRNIINKTPEAVKALEQLRDAQGKAIRFDIAEIKAKGFTNALKDLNTALNGNSQLLADVIPDSLAFSSALGLMAENAKVLEDNTKKITETGKKAGEYLEKAFDIKLGDRAAKFEQIVNRFTESLIKFGEGLAPAFDTGIAALEKASNFVNNMPAGLKVLITNVAMGTLAFKSFTGAVTSMAGGLASAFLTFQSFRLMQRLFTGALKDDIAIIKGIHKEGLGLIPVLKQLVGIDQNYLLVQKAQGIVTKNRFQVIGELREQKKGLVAQFKQLIGIDQQGLLQNNKGTEALRSRITAIERYANSSKKLKTAAQEVATAGEALNNSVSASSVLEKDKEDKEIKTTEWRDLYTEESRKLSSLSVTGTTPEEIEEQTEAIRKQAKVVSDAHKEVLASEEALNKAKEDIAKNEEKRNKATTEYTEKLKENSKLQENLEASRKKISDAYIVAEDAKKQATVARAKATIMNIAADKEQALYDAASNKTAAMQISLDNARARAKLATKAATDAETLSTQANTVARQIDLYTTRELLVAEGTLLKTRLFLSKLYLPNNFITKALTMELFSFKDLLAGTWTRVLALKTILSTPVKSFIGAVTTALAGGQSAIEKSTNLLRTGWLNTVNLASKGWNTINTLISINIARLGGALLASKAWAIVHIANIQAVIAAEGLVKGSQILGGKAFQGAISGVKNLLPLLGKGVGLAGGLVAVAGGAMLVWDNFFGFGKVAKEALKDSVKSTEELKKALREANSEFYSLVDIAGKGDKGAWKTLWEGTVKAIKDASLGIKGIVEQLPVISQILSAINKVSENYRYNQIIESISAASNSAELAGKVWEKTAISNQKYINGLYTTEQLNKKVSQGLVVTIADLNEETKAYQANKKEREAAIKDNENQVAVLKKLREGVENGSPRAEVLDNNIKLIETQLEKLKEASVKQEEYFELLKKINQERNILINRKSLWANEAVSDQDLEVAKKSAEEAASKLAIIFNKAIADPKNQINLDLVGDKRNEAFGKVLQDKQAELTKLAAKIEADRQKNLNTNNDVKDFQAKQVALQGLTKAFQDYNALESEYLEKTRKREATKPEDIGFNATDTALKKSIRYSEEALSNYFAKLAAVRDGFESYVDPTTNDIIKLSKEGLAELEGGADKLLTKLDSHLADIQARFDEGYLNGKEAADKLNKVLDLEVISIKKVGDTTVEVKQKIKEFLDPKDIISIVQQQLAFLNDASNKEIARQQEFLTQYKTLQDARLISTKQALQGIAEAEKAFALERVETQKRVLKELEDNKAGSPEQIEVARRKLNNLVLEYQATIFKSSSTILNNEKDTTLKTIQFKTELFKGYEQSRRISSIGAIKELGKFELESAKTNFAAILAEYENAKKNNLSVEEITTLGRQAVLARELVVNKQFELETSLIEKTAQLERESLDRRLKLYRGFIDAKQLTTKEATKKINELEKKQLENDLKEIDKKIALAEKGVIADVPDMDIQAKEIEKYAKPQLDELRNIGSLVEKISGQIDKEKPTLPTAEKSVIKYYNSEKDLPPLPSEQPTATKSIFTYSNTPLLPTKDKSVIKYYNSEKDLPPLPQGEPIATKSISTYSGQTIKPKSIAPKAVGTDFFDKPKEDYKVPDTNPAPNEKKTFIDKVGDAIFNLFGGKAVAATVPQLPKNTAPIPLTAINNAIKQSPDLVVKYKENREAIKASLQAQDVKSISDKAEANVYADKKRIQDNKDVLESFAKAGLVNPVEAIRKQSKASLDLLDKDIQAANEKLEKLKAPELNINQEFIEEAKRNLQKLLAERKQLEIANEEVINDERLKRTTITYDQIIQIANNKLASRKANELDVITVVNKAESDKAKAEEEAAKIALNNGIKNKKNVVDLSQLAKSFTEAQTKLETINYNNSIKVIETKKNKAIESSNTVLAINAKNQEAHRKNAIETAKIENNAILTRLNTEANALKEQLNNKELSTDKRTALERDYNLKVTEIGSQRIKGELQVNEITTQKQKASLDTKFNNVKAYTQAKTLTEAEGVKQASVLANKQFDASIQDLDKKLATAKGKGTKQSQDYIKQLLEQRQAVVANQQAQVVKSIGENADAGIAAPKKKLTDARDLLDSRSKAKEVDPVTALNERKKINLELADLEIKAQKEKLEGFRALGDKFNKEDFAAEERSLQKLVTTRKEIELDNDEAIRQERLRIQKETADNILNINQNLLASKKVDDLKYLQTNAKLLEDNAKAELKRAEDYLAYAKKKGQSQSAIAEAQRAVTIAQSNLDRIAFDNSEKYTDKTKEIKLRDISFISAFAKSAEEGKRKSIIETTRLEANASQAAIKAEMAAISTKLKNRQLSPENKKLLEKDYQDLNNRLTTQNIVSKQKEVTIFNQLDREKLNNQRAINKELVDSKALSTAEAYKKTKQLNDKEFQDSLKTIDQQIKIATDKKTKQSPEEIKRLKDQREVVAAQIKAQNVRSIAEQAEAGISTPKKVLADNKELLDTKVKSRDVDALTALQANKTNILSTIDLEIKAQEEKIAKYKKLGKEFSQEAMAEEKRNLSKLLASREEAEISTEEAIRQERVRIHSETAEVILAKEQNLLDTRVVGELDFLKRISGLLLNKAKQELDNAKENLDYLKKNNKSKTAIQEADNKLVLAKSNYDKVAFDNTIKQTQKTKEISLQNISFQADLVKTYQEGKIKGAVEVTKTEAKLTQAEYQAKRKALVEELKTNNMAATEKTKLLKQLANLDAQNTTQVITNKHKEVDTVISLDKERFKNQGEITKNLVNARTMSLKESTKQLAEQAAKESGKDLAGIEAKLKVATAKATRQSSEEIERLKDQREIIKTSIQAQAVKSIVDKADANIYAPKKKLTDEKELLDLRSKSKDIDSVTALEKSQKNTLAIADLEIKAQQEKLAEFRKLGDKFNKEDYEAEKRNLDKLITQRKEAEFSGDEAIRQERIRVHGETINTIIAKEQNLVEARRTGELDYIKKSGALLLAKAKDEIANIKDSLNYFKKNNKSKVAIQEEENKLALARSNYDKIAADNNFKIIDKTKEVSLKNISFQSDLLKTYNDGKLKGSVEIVKQENKLTREQYTAQRKALTDLLRDRKLAASERVKLEKELANLDAQNTTQTILNKHKETDTVIGLNKEQFKNQSETIKQLASARALSVADATKQSNELARKEANEDLVAVNSKLKTATSGKVKQSPEEIKRLKQQRELIQTGLQAQVVSDIAEEADSKVKARKDAIAGERELLDIKLKNKDIDSISAATKNKELALNNNKLEIQAQEEKIEKFRKLGKKFSAEAMAEEKRNLEKLVAQREEIEFSSEETIRQERIRIHGETVDVIIAKEQNLVDARRVGELDAIKKMGALLLSRATLEVTNAKKSLDFLKANNKSKTTIQEADNKLALATSNRDKLITDNAVKYTEKKRDVQLQNISFTADLVKTYQQASLKNTIDIVKTETKLTQQEYKARRAAIVDQLNDKKLAATEEKKLRQQLTNLDAKATADNIINQKKATETIIGLDNSRLKNQGEITKQLASARQLSLFEATKRSNAQAAKEYNNSLVEVNSNLNLATTQRQSPEEIEKLKQQRELIKVSQQAQIVKSIAEEAEAKTKARRDEIADTKELLDLGVKSKTVDSIDATKKDKKLALENNALEISAQQEKIEKFKKLGDKFSAEEMAKEKRNLAKLVAQRGEIELTADENIRQERIRRNQSVIDTIITQEQNLLDTRRVGELEYLRKISPLLVSKAKQDVADAKENLDYLKKNNKSRADIAEAGRKLSIAQSNLDKTVVDNRFKLLDASKNKELTNIGFISSAAKTYAESRRKSSLEVARMENRASAMTLQVEKNSIKEQLNDNKLSKDQRALFVKQLADNNQRAITDNIVARQKESDILLGLDRERLRNQKDMLKELTDAKAYTAKDAVKQALELEMKDLLLEARDLDKKIKQARKDGQSPEYIGQLEGQKGVNNTRIQSATVRGIRERADAGIAADAKRIADNKELLATSVKAKDIDSVEATKQDTKLTVQNINLQLQAQANKLADFKKLGKKFNQEAYDEEKRAYDKLVAQRKEIEYSGEESIRQEKIRVRQETLDVLTTKEQNLVDTKQIGEIDYLKRISPLLAKKAREEVDNAQKNLDSLRAKGKAQSFIDEAERKLALARSNEDKVSYDSRTKLIEANKNKELTAIGFVSNAAKIAAEGRTKTVLEIAQIESNAAKDTLKTRRDALVAELDNNKLAPQNRKNILLQIRELDNQAKTDRITSKEKEIDIITAKEKELVSNQKALIKELADARSLSFKDSVLKNYEQDIKDLNAELDDVNKKIANAKSEGQSPDELRKLNDRKKLVEGRIQSTEVRGIDDRANAAIFAPKKLAEDTRDINELLGKSKQLDPIEALKRAKKSSLEIADLEIEVQENKLAEYRNRGDKFNKENYEIEQRELQKLSLRRKEMAESADESIRQERIRKNQEALDVVLTQEQNLLDTRKYSELEYLAKTSPLLATKAQDEIQRAKDNLERLKREGKARTFIVEAENKLTLAQSNYQKVTYDTRLKNIEATKNVEVRNANFLAGVARSYEESRRKGILETTLMSNKAAQDSLQAERKAIVASLKERGLSVDQSKALQQQLLDVNNRVTNQTIEGKEKEIDVVNNLAKDQLTRDKDIAKQLIEARAVSVTEGAKKVRELELKSTDRDIATLDKKIKQASEKGTQLSKEAIKQLTDQRKLLLVNKQTQVVSGISEQAEDNVKAARKRIAYLSELGKLQQGLEKQSEADFVASQTKLSLQDIDASIQASADKLKGYRAQGKKVNKEVLEDETNNYNKLVASRRETEEKGAKEVQQIRLRTNQETTDRLIAQEQNYLDARQLSELDFLKRTNPLLIQRAKDAIDAAEKDLENAKRKGKAKEVIAQYESKLEVARSNLEKVNFDTRSRYIDANKNKELAAINFLSNMNKTYEEGKRKGTLETLKVDNKAALDSLAREKEGLETTLKTQKLAPEQRKLVLRELALINSRATNQTILGKQKEIELSNSLDQENLRYQKDMLAQLVSAKAITAVEAVKQQNALSLKEIDSNISAIEKKIVDANNKTTKLSKEAIARLDKERKLLLATRQSTVVGDITEKAEAGISNAKKTIEDLKALSQAQVGAKSKSEIQGVVDQANLSLQSIDLDIQASRDRLAGYKKEGKKVSKETVEEENRTYKNLQAQRTQIAREASEKRVASVYEVENKALQNSIDIITAYRQAGSVDEVEAAKKVSKARIQILDNQITTEKSLLKKLKDDAADPSYIKDQAAKVTKLQADRKTLTIEGVKEVFRIEQDHSNRLIALRRDAAQVLSDVQIKSAVDTVKAVNQLEVTQLKQDLNNKINYYNLLKNLNPNNKKALEEAGLEIALVRNRLAAQEIKSVRSVGEARLKDFQTQSDLEINQIKLNKVARNLYEEDEYRAVMKNRFRINKEEQTYLRQRIQDAKAKGYYTIELEKELSNKLVEEVSLRNEKMAKEYEIARAKAENIDQRTLLGFTKQLNLLETFTKQLQLEQTLRESNKTLVEATNNANISALEREGKLRKSIIDKAELDFKIAQAQYKNRSLSLLLDKESLKVKEAETRLALDRQDIELKRSVSETKRSIANTQQEIAQERTGNRDKQKLERLAIELESLREREALNSREVTYQEQNRKVTEQSLENQRKSLELSSKEEQKNARVELRLAAVNKIVARYEHLIRVEETASVKEANNSTVRLALNERLNKAYQVRTELLEKQKALLNSRDTFAQDQLKFAQGLTNNEYLKVRLAKQAALINLQTLDKRQTKEALLLELQLKQNKLALERQKIEQNVAELRAEREESIAKYKYQQSLNNGTPEEQEQNRLALEEKVTNKVLTKANRENIATQEILNKVTELSSREEQRLKFYTERQQGAAAYQQATGSPSQAIALIRQAMQNGQANSDRVDNRAFYDFLRSSPFVAKTAEDTTLPKQSSLNIEKEIQQRVKALEEQAKSEANRNNKQIDKQVTEASILAASKALTDSLKSLSSVVENLNKAVPTLKEAPKPLTMQMSGVQLWDLERGTTVEQEKQLYALKDPNLRVLESIDISLADIKKNVIRLAFQLKPQQRRVIPTEKKPVYQTMKMAAAQMWEKPPQKMALSGHSAVTESSQYRQFKVDGLAPTKFLNVRTFSLAGQNSTLEDQVKSQSHISSDRVKDVLYKIWEVLSVIRKEAITIKDILIGQRSSQSKVTTEIQLRTINNNIVEANKELKKLNSNFLTKQQVIQKKQATPPPKLTTWKMTGVSKTASTPSISGANRTNRLTAIDKDIDTISKQQNRVIAFVGDSITAAGRKSGTTFEGRKVLNLGVSGDRTDQISQRLPGHLDRLGKSPSDIVLLAGINDLRQGKSIASIAANISDLVKTIRREQPKSRLIVESVLPTRLDSIPTKKVEELNKQIKKIAETNGATFLNLVPSFVQQQNKLQKTYTTDGLHLSQRGYQKLGEVLKNAVTPPPKPIADNSAWRMFAVQKYADKPKPKPKTRASNVTSVLGSAIQAIGKKAPATTKTSSLDIKAIELQLKTSNTYLKEIKEAITKDKEALQVNRKSEVSNSKGAKTTATPTKVEKHYHIKIEAPITNKIEGAANPKDFGEKVGKQIWKTLDEATKEVERRSK